MPQHLHQLESSFLFKNETFGTILVHSPLVRDTTGLQLYNFQNLPIKSKTKNYDVLLNPQKDFLAIDDQNTLYSEFSSSELQNCMQVNR